MSYELISYELKGNIAVIAFNDPKTMNACGVDTAQECCTPSKKPPTKRAAPSSRAMAGAFARARTSEKSPARRSAIRGSKPDAGRRWTPITTR